MTNPLSMTNPLCDKCAGKDECKYYCPRCASKSGSPPGDLRWELVYFEPYYGNPFPGPMYRLTPDPPHKLTMNDFDEMARMMDEMEEAE